MRDELAGGTVPTLRVRQKGTHRLSTLHPAPMWKSAIVVFAKTPQPGASKTRLCPPLGFDDAAELSRCFIRDTAATVVRVAGRTYAGGVVQPFVSCSGDVDRMQELVGDRFELIAQRGASFGERLSNAVADVFALGYDAVFAIDSDSPTLPDEALFRGVAALANARDRVALGPCADGGYYCLGMTRFDPSLFEEIAWSTDRVFSQTHARATAAGFGIDVLPRWYDVDDGASLAILSEELFGTGDLRGGHGPGAPAPHSESFLRELAGREPLVDVATEIAS